MIFRCAAGVNGAVLLFGRKIAVEGSTSSFDLRSRTRAAGESRRHQGGNQYIPVQAVGKQLIDGQRYLVLKRRG